MTASERSELQVARATRSPEPSAVTPPSRYADQWRARLTRLPAYDPRTALGLSPGDTVLVIGAHPDDETFGAGATIAELTSSDVVVHVVALTAGEAALRHVGRDLPHLARQRRDELDRAAQALGVASATTLDLPDAGLADRPVEVAETVRHLLREHRPDHVLTTWWEDPHADHAAVGNAVRRGAAHAGTRFSAVPIWAYHWADPEPLLRRASPVTRSIPSVAARAARAAAIACYPSQTQPLADDLQPILPPALVAWDVELLVGS